MERTKRSNVKILTVIKQVTLTDNKAALIKTINRIIVIVQTTQLTVTMQSLIKAATTQLISTSMTIATIAVTVLILPITFSIQEALGTKLSRHFKSS